MATKETTELGVFIGKVINAAFLSFADGKLNVQDLINFLEPALAGQPAFEGIKLVGKENMFMTTAERETVKKTFAGTLSGVPDSDRYDITEMFSGYLATYRLGYKLGHKAGEDAILEDLKAGKIDLASLEPDAE